MARTSKLHRMRTLWFTILILAGMAAAPAAGAQAQFSPSEADFSVAFPEAPQVFARPANRSKDIAIRRYVSEGRGRALIVSIEDYPDGSLPMGADAGVYDRMLRSLADSNNGQLVSTRAARLAGKPCLEGRITDPSGDQEIVRILMIGQRVYEVTYALPEGADPQGADAAFFNSFRITSAP